VASTSFQWTIDGMNVEPVVLLHGIWMRGFSLGALRAKLEKAGYAPHLFEYASVAHGPEPSVERLIQKISRLQAPRVHMVGHSLGGLIALQAARRADALPPGHIVCLGSPLKGSAAARGLSRFPGGAVVMGRSGEILREGLACWDGVRPVGVIAGRVPVGLGALVGALEAPHDGTVSVAETRLEGIADHVVVPATHSGLAFSAEAAEQIVVFLREGRFRANGSAETAAP
jgi:pimeloyl-ACP methyl ester carboxylesterase